MYVLVDGCRSADPPTNWGSSSAIFWITLPECARVAAAAVGPAARTAAKVDASMLPREAVSNCAESAGLAFCQAANFARQAWCSPLTASTRAANSCRTSSGT